MEDLSLMIGERVDIPVEMLPDIAYLTRQTKLQWGVPAPSQDFIQGYLVKPPRPGAGVRYVTGYNKDEPIAWGTIEYEDEGEPGYELAFIYVYVVPKYRNRGVGTRIFTEIFKYIPAYVKQVDTGIIAHSPAENYLTQKVLAQLQNQDGVILNKIREADLGSKKPADFFSTQGYDLKLLKNEEIEDYASEFFALLGKLGSDAKTNWLEAQYRGRRRLAKAGNADLWHYLLYQQGEAKPIAVAVFMIGPEEVKETAWLERIGMTAGYRTNEIGEALLLSGIHQLLAETQVTHLLKYSGDKPDYLVDLYQQYGFKALLTNGDYIIERADWEAFLEGL